MKRIEPERIARVARIYASNEDASRALGIAAGSFSRLCRRYGIETPYARKRRRCVEARTRRVDVDGGPSVEEGIPSLEDGAPGAESGTPPAEDGLLNEILEPDPDW